MGNDGGKIGKMTGGTYSDTGKQRFGSFERYERGKLRYSAGAAVMDIGPRTVRDGPQGSMRQAAARRVRRWLTGQFGRSGGWGSGRGPHRIGVNWGRTRAWARPPGRATGMITARGRAGRRALNQLRNSKSKRDTLRRNRIRLGTRVRRIGTAPDGQPIYGITVSATPI